jgi:hypothetical protein
MRGLRTRSCRRYGVFPSFAIWKALSYSLPQVSHFAIGGSPFKLQAWHVRMVPIANDHGLEATKCRPPIDPKMEEAFLFKFIGIEH